MGAFLALEEKHKTTACLTEERSLSFVYWMALKRAVWVSKL